MLVGGIVVDDEMDVRHIGLDVTQEGEEFLVTMAGFALGDDRAVEHVEGGEQGTFDNEVDVDPSARNFPNDWLSASLYRARRRSNSYLTRRLALASVAVSSFPSMMAGAPLPPFHSPRTKRTRRPFDSESKSTGAFCNSWQCIFMHMPAAN
jgi:hypothetical protein